MGSQTHPVIQTQFAMSINGGVLNFMLQKQDNVNVFGALRCARSHASRTSMGEVLALLDAPLEAVPRAGGGRGAVGDVDAAKTARLASRARQGASDGGAAHRGLLLDEVDADTAACGVLERPLGLVVEAVAPKTV